MWNEEKTNKINRVNSPRSLSSTFVCLESLQLLLPNNNPTSHCGGGIHRSNSTLPMPHKCFEQCKEACIKLEEEDKLLVRIWCGIRRIQIKSTGSTRLKLQALLLLIDLNSWLLGIHYQQWLDGTKDIAQFQIRDDHFVLGANARVGRLWLWLLLHLHLCLIVDPEENGRAKEITHIINTIASRARTWKYHEPQTHHA